MSVKGVTTIGRIKNEEDPGLSSGMFARLRNDASYRKNIINTICFYSSFIAMSFAKGPIGPAFLDIQAISGVGLEGGSSLFTTLYIGYMVGAIISGYLFDKLERSLMLSVVKFILACTTVAIPWCSFFWLMVMAFFFMGAMVGATDAISNAGVQRIWGKDGKPFMQGLQFMYSFGISVAPLVAFLFMNSPKTVHGGNSDTQLNGTSIGNYSIQLNGTDTLQNRSSDTRNGSVIPEEPTFVRSLDLYKVFIIGGAVCMISFAMHLTFYFTSERCNKSNREKIAIAAPGRSRLPLSVQIQAVLHMAGIQALLTGIDDTWVAFLTAFCVKMFKWTKGDGALLTSANSFVAVGGRFIAIFLVQIVSPIKLVGLHSILTLLAFLGLYISVLYTSDIGMWVVSLLFGYAKAPILACVFSWTDEVFLPVSGRIASIFLVFSTASSAINPLILGILMENFSNMWFCYLFLGESVLLVIVVGSALLLTRRVCKVYGTNYKSRQIEVQPSEGLLDTTTK
ncbi:sodium-dependent glucose transporter 1A-like [Argopecten irradians]|uniref:sodium-dependent glucose transporter 1A-like n=1 Tax=Argopecten irradians TaxID=31199 RepID=UPI003712B888